MLDKNSLIVLKALNKLADADAYKVVTLEDVMSNMGGKANLEAEVVKQIIEFLSKQEYINIKFSEDGTYCYSILQKAKLLLEQTPATKKATKQKPQILNYVLTGVSAFVGTMLALIIFFLI